MLAKPGSVELKINDKLCHLKRGKGFLASSERVMAGLTKGLLKHNEIMKRNLQDVINWVSNPFTDLTPSNLFETTFVFFWTKLTKL